MTILRTFLRPLPVLGLAAVLAACGSGGQINPPTGQPDYRAAYPIRTQERTFAAPLPVDAVLEASLGINEYRRRARGPMVLVVPDEGGPRALRAAEILGWWLDSQMIEVVAVRAAPGVPGADVADGSAVTAFFRGHVALVPDCGNWSGETGYNPTNLPHTNFGCAYQRNIGLMLSDPKDLEDPRDLGAFSGFKAANILGKWYAGEFTGAAVPPNEKAGVSNVIAPTE